MFPIQDSHNVIDILRSIANTPSGIFNAPSTDSRGYGSSIQMRAIQYNPPVSSDASRLGEKSAWPYALTGDNPQTSDCDSRTNPCPQSTVQQRSTSGQSLQREDGCKDQEKNPCDHPSNQPDEGREIELPGGMGTITEKDVDEFVDSLLLKAKIKKMQRQEARANSADTYSDTACSPCRPEGGPARRSSNVVPAAKYFTVGEKKSANLAPNNSPLVSEE